MHVPDITLELCRPLESCARMVMRWRNDPVTLEMSYHHQPKQWDAFWPWFSRLTSGYQPFPSYLAMLDGKPAAHLHFESASHPQDPTCRCCNVSINVNPELRGRGVGPAALRLAGSALARLGWDGILAEVRQGNQASQACFHKAGFVCLGTGIKIVEDTGEAAEIKTFFLDLRQQRQQSDARCANQTASFHEKSR